LGSTKTETTVKILNAIKYEIENMAAKGATDDELTRAKDSVLKGFAFDFDSTGKIVQRMVSYDYYGYPRDYLQQYRAQIEKVSHSDVVRVAKQYLKTDQLAILVVGKQKGIDQPLSSLGPVKTIDITIPKPTQEALAAATPESIAKGKALLRAVRQAMGGAALDQVKDYTTIASLTISMPQGELALKMESTMSFAGRMLTKMSTPMGEMVQGFDGQAMWVRTPQGAQDMPASQRAELEGGFFRDTLSLLRNAENPAYIVQALGPSEVDGKPAEGVAVSDPARKLQLRLWVDPKTNLLVKKTYVAALLGPPGEIEEIYSDYREAGGLKLPFKILLNRSGKKFGEQTITEIKINPGVAESAYKKPQ
jgi:hypothetical protein